MKETKTKTFLNPAQLLKAVEIESDMNVADFGCGNGYYSIAAATVVGKKGQVYAFDILEDALSQTVSLAKLTGLHNVATKLCDLEKLGATELPDTICDLVIVSGILHQIADKKNVLREAYRVLKTSGKILVIEWQKDSPLGPPQAERLGREEAVRILEGLGFRPIRDLPAGSFHYAVLYSK